MIRSLILAAAMAITLGGSALAGTAASASIIGDGSHGQAVAAAHHKCHHHKRHCTRHHPCVYPGYPNIPVPQSIIGDAAPRSIIGD